MWAWVVVACVVVVVPMFEELLYRGFLQSYFVRVINGGESAARPVAAVGRSRRHRRFSPRCTWRWARCAVDAAAAPFVLSMGLGFAFEKTGRGWACRS